MDRTIKVLIADDHPVVRQGLKQILLKTPGMIVSAEAADGKETLEKARTQPWDVMVLDINMPGRNGFDILKELNEEYGRLPVLVLSMHSEDEFALHILKAGASGYLTKESAPSELVNAIRKVVNGGKYISPSLAEKLAFSKDLDAERPLHETLSNREFQVMQMMGQGKTAMEIAQELALSVKTVSTYRARILKKMDLKSNAEIIRYAIQHQLAV
jgi:two-component system, NarL family, invasion response regulator UvrY